MPDNSYDNKVAVIRKLIWVMAGEYPNGKFLDRHMQSYIRAVEGYSLEIIGKAIPLAIKERRGHTFNSAHMPTADNIRMQCKMLKAAYVPPDVRERGPSKPNHVLPPDNPFMRLASLWEEQSKKLELDPSKPAPEDVGQDRFKTFWDTWKFSGLG